MIRFGGESSAYLMGETYALRKRASLCWLLPAPPFTVIKRVLLIVMTLKSASRCEALIVLSHLWQNIPLCQSTTVLLDRVSSLPTGL